MKFIKKAAVAAVCAVCTTGFVFAQQTVTSADNSKSETTVEDEYLSSVEDVIVSELASSEDYDNKQVALQYLEDAVNEGRVTPAMAQALESLAGEGIKTVSKTNGRQTNNYPDIRAKACDLLGKVPTEESKNALVDIALSDNESMVITAAIRSLGDIGINNNDEVVTAIAWAQKKNAALTPTSSLAFEVLVAYEKLLPTVEDKSAIIESITQIATNYHYVTPVRTKALEMLRQLNNKSAGKTK